jgi:serine/threonine protein kinase
MIEAGKVLQNRYRVQKQIGQGGMGAVYVATDERFGSVVAIKETLVLEDHFRKAIEREARLLNSLKHPALPRVSDHFDDENGQFIVMEYIAGEDLSEMMERSKKAFLLEKVMNWADQLLDALEFLHTQEIPVIHRDIKPQNLKLTPRGQIILLDFGLAKGNPTDAAHQTAAKSIFGYSRNYASLEQIQGTGTDPRSDLYSLAATLYHLMTGIAPEDALTRAMHVLSGQADTLQPANAVHQQVPRGVAAVLQNSMDLNSNQRPASAKEMRQMLRDHEKYAHLIENENLKAANTIVGTPIATDVLARETQLLPITGGNQTDVQTQVLPDNLSQETKVKAVGANGEAKTANFYAAENTQPNLPKKRNLLGIAALVGLLLAVSGLAGTYFLKPEALGFNSGANDSIQPNNSVEAVVENRKDTDANAEPSNNQIVDSNTTPVVADNNQSTAKTIAETSVKTDPSAKQNEPSVEKNTAKKDKKTVSSDSDDITLGDGEVRIKGDKVYIGNMVITDKQIKTPDGVFNIDDDDEDQPQKPIVPRNLPTLTPDQIRKLTPRQRQKLKRIRENQQVVTPPAPVSPPKPPPY